MQTRVLTVSPTFPFPSLRNISESAGEWRYDIIALSELVPLADAQVRALQVNFYLFPSSLKPSRSSHQLTLIPTSIQHD
jgi:hypothetical protein